MCRGSRAVYSGLSAELTRGRHVGGGGGSMGVSRLSCAESWAGSRRIRSLGPQTDQSRTTDRSENSAKSLWGGLCWDRAANNPARLRLNQTGESRVDCTAPSLLTLAKGYGIVPWRVNFMNLQCELLISPAKYGIKLISFYHSRQLYSKRIFRY